MSIQIAGSLAPGELKINPDGSTNVVTDLKVDIDDLGNSTTANLAANLQFTGVWRDCTAYKSITLFILANQNSAAGGLKIQFSNDGSTVDFSWDISTTASVPRYYNYPIFGKFFRIIYVNGGTAQTQMRINSRLSFAVADITNRVADFIVVATAAVGVAAAVTLPAAGVGTYHYITSIRIEKFATGLMTVGTVPVVATTSNLNGFSPNTGANAQPQGVNEIVMDRDFTIPLKSQNANTSTSLGMPATPLAIYKVMVTYFVAA
jgi:hypothetical protein